MNNIEITKKIIFIFKKKYKNFLFKSYINFVKDRPGHDQRYCLDSTKIKTKLKIKIKSNLDKKIEETIDWYKNRFEENFFKNNKFKNRTGLNI